MHVVVMALPRIYVRTSLVDHGIVEKDAFYINLAEERVDQVLGRFLIVFGVLVGDRDLKTVFPDRTQIDVLPLLVGAVRCHFTAEAEADVTYSEGNNRVLLLEDTSDVLKCSNSVGLPH